MALLIKVDGTQEEVNGKNDDGSFILDQLKGAIGGGYIEVVACDPKVTGGYSCFVCDEEGKLKQFPANERATELSTYTSAFDVVCGDVLFCKEEEIV
jgi:hypothetical protein